MQASQVKFEDLTKDCRKLKRDLTGRTTVVPASSCADTQKRAFNFSDKLFCIWLIRCQSRTKEK